MEIKNKTTNREIEHVGFSSLNTDSLSCDCVVKVTMFIQASSDLLESFLEEGETGTGAVFGVVVLFLD